MKDDVYEQLAKTLDNLPNGFPRTSSGVEILILKKIFSHDEAWLASQLGGTVETVEAIAKRARLPEEELEKQLMRIVNRGLL